MSKKASHILIVEDETSHAQLIRRSFESCSDSMHLSMAFNLKEARTFLSTETPDLVITDFLLPDGKGLELLQDHEKQALFPIIVLTAHGDENVAVEAMKAGALDYVIKSEEAFADMPHIVERALREWKSIIKNRQAEKALEENEERFRLLYEKTPLGYQSLDKNGRIIEVNQAWLTTLGYSREEVIGKSFGDFLHPDWVDHFKENFPRFKDLGEVVGVEFNMVKKDGTFIIVSFNGKISHDETGQFKQTHCILHDITDKKRAEEALKKSEERYRDLYENAPNPYFSISAADGSIARCNAKAVQLLGYDKDALIGMQFYDLLADGPYDFSRVQDVLERFEAGETVHDEELQMKQKDGHPIWVSLTLEPMKDPNGNIIETRSTAINISERKNLESQFVEAQKMESIGTLAGGIAHDFNNILFSIIGNTELVIHHELPEQHPALKSLEQILQASQRAADLVRQILTFSRKKEQILTPALISPIVKETIKLLRASLPATIKINHKITTKSDMALVDPSQIHQVLMNLCTNAAHAMHKDGGVLTIRLKDVDPGSPELASYPNLNSKPCLMLAIGDTGYGMEHSIMGRIFEPYFTTKPMEEGTGLGLAVVHGIIKSFEGEIHVESELGKGSIFTIYLPQTESQATPEYMKRESPPGGNETILFVDDEAPVVKVAKQMLEKMGYKITTRTNSIQALEDFRRQPDKFDLIVTDMTMPNLTGDKLAKEIMQIRPDIPIILCTGYTDLITKEAAKHMGIREFIMKPLNRLQLAKTIRKVLDSRNP